MSGAIGPGDWGEALRDWPIGLIVKGKVYQIAGMQDPMGLLACTECGVPPIEAPGFSLTCDSSELREKGAWCPCGFKPIYRPKPDAFADLLKLPDMAHVG